MRARSAALLTTLVLALGVVTAPPALAAETFVVQATVVTAGGTPIPNERVTLLSTGENAGTLVAIGYTDDTGLVSLPAIAPGDYDLQYASRIDWMVTPQQRALTVDGPEQEAFVAPRVVALSGTVRDAVTGAPVKDLSVQGTDSADLLTMMGWTGTDGSYTAFGLADTYTLAVGGSVAGYEELTPAGTVVLDTAHDVVGHDLKAWALSHLRGRVTRGGTGLATLVHLGQAGAVGTAPSGTYDAVVTPGTYAPFVSGDDGSFPTYLGNTVRKPDARRLVVGRGRTATADIAVVRSATVSGTVVDRKGRAAKYVEVWGANLDRAGEAHATTDSKGRFTLRGLATGQVRIDVAGGTDARPAFGHRTVTARQGATVTAAVTLRDDAIIYGKVRTTGSRVTKQDVTVRTADGVLVATVRPEADGFVGVGGLAAGTYYVHVDGGNLRRKVVVKAHQTVSWGTMTRGRLVTVKGVVKTSAGKPAVGATVLLTDRYSTGYAFARTNAKGAWSAKVAVAGAYTIVVRPTKLGADTTTRVKVTVRKGTTLTRNVRLTKGATVTGVVLNAQGKPAVGVRVETSDGRRATTTNASGAYTLTGVEPVRQRLWVSDPAYVGGYRNGSTLVTARAGTTVKAPRATVR